MILSFAWTTDALLKGCKNVTRRDWTPDFTQLWQRAWDAGRRTHEAWDKSPRARGHRVGWIELTHRPYTERLADMPIEDLQAEGGYWHTVEEFAANFGGLDAVVTVLRFRWLGARDHPTPIPAVAGQGEPPGLRAN